MLLSSLALVAAAGCDNRAAPGDSGEIVDPGRTGGRGGGPSRTGGGGGGDGSGAGGGGDPGPGAAGGSAGRAGEGPGVDAAAPPDGTPTGDVPAPEGGLPVLVPRTVVLDATELARARQRLLAGDPAVRAALDKLLEVAEPALEAGPWSVMDKTTVPPSGDKHDYLSLSRYYWPNARASNGCPYVHRDGMTNPDTTSNKYDHASRHAAMDAIYNLAFAYYFTGQARYAERAALVARTWFLDPATAMNPNVDFGEYVPCFRDGGRTGVLNWTELIGQALDGIAVLDAGAPGWLATDQERMRAWVTSFLDWHLTSRLGIEEAESTNNHATWYDVGAGAMMVYLGRTREAAALMERAKTRRIASQVRGDGSQPEELRRSNSWSYSNWNIEGLCRLAFTAERVQVDLWSYTAPGGGTLAKAAEYLIAGATRGRQGWPHPQASAFEQSWALSPLQAAAKFGGSARARAALPDVPVAPEGDLWPLLPVCTAAAIQPN